MTSLKPALALCGAALLFSGGAALAQTAALAQSNAAQGDAASGVVTPAAAAVAQTDTTDAQIAAWTAAPPPSPTDAPAKGEAAAPRQIHGEAGAAIGSDGYRSGYVTTDIPIGANSDLGLGVSESQIKLKHGPTLTNQSLALSLSLGKQTAPPSDCGRSLRVNNQNVEPLWVSHLRGAPLAPGEDACGKDAD
jgi:hypothetical protein